MFDVVASAVYHADVGLDEDVLRDVITSVVIDEEVGFIKDAKFDFSLLYAIIKLHFFCPRRFGIHIAYFLAFSLDFDLQAGSFYLLLDLEITPIIIVIPNEAKSIEEFSKQSS